MNDFKRFKYAELSWMIETYHRKIKQFFEAKTSIIRDAVRAYLAQPIYTLEPTKIY